MSILWSVRRRECVGQLRSQILFPDWSKTLHLQRDRSLSLHTQSGLHHNVRLPTYGRTLAYHAPSADALIGCSGTEVYRFNLDEGRFMAPIQVRVSIASRLLIWSLLNGPMHHLRM